MRTTFRHRRIRIIPVSIATLLLIGVILLLILFPYSGSIRYDIVYNGERLTGVILRTEHIVDLSSYEKVLFENMVDGQRLEQGEKIVTAYKKGYLKTSLDKLRETEKNIVAYQNQSVITGYDDRKIVMYDFDIEVLIRRMSEETEGYITLYHDLCRVMAERESYIRATYNTESNTYLQGLYQDEVSLLESLRVWRDELAATEEGYLGFYCNQSEGELSPGADMTLQQVKELVKREKKPMQNAFKVVTEEAWYIAVPVDRVDGRFTVEEHYPLYIGNADTYEPARLVSVQTEKRGAILLFRLEDNVEKYLDLFSTDLFVGQRVEGFSVPNRYVKNDSIKIKDDSGEEQNIPIQILYHDKDRTVFAPNDACRVGGKVYR
ncbi:MAG: hypothetical protein J6X30_04685 [Clostridia bacterium]|nr:hypothetical protein [Clostridia bacterium]